MLVFILVSISIFMVMFVFIFINISLTLVTLIMANFILLLMKITLISWSLLNWKTNQFLHLMMIFYFYYKIVWMQNLNHMIFRAVFLFFNIYLMMAMTLHINPFPFPWPSSFLVHYILTYLLNLNYLSSYKYVLFHLYIILVLAVKYIFVQPLYFYIIDIVHQ